MAEVDCHMLYFIVGTQNVNDNRPMDKEGWLKIPISMWYNFNTSKRPCLMSDLKISKIFHNEKRKWGLIATLSYFFFSKVGVIREGDNHHTVLFHSRRPWWTERESYQIGRIYSIGSLLEGRQTYIRTVYDKSLPLRLVSILNLVL